MPLGATVGRALLAALELAELEVPVLELAELEFAELVIPVLELAELELAELVVAELDAPEVGPVTGTAAVAIGVAALPMTVGVVAAPCCPTETVIVAGSLVTLVMLVARTVIV